jgi:hypothetical protein
MPMQAKRYALPFCHLGWGDWVWWNGNNRSLGGASAGVRGDCVTPEGVRGGWVGPRGSNRMLVDPSVIYRGSLAPLAGTGGWVKTSGFNSTLYGPQAVIGGCVVPWGSNRGLCDHRDSNRKLCGTHRQQMYSLWILAAVIQVWVCPIDSYMMLCGPQQ